jgi:hypothetical protein
MVTALVTTIAHANGLNQRVAQIVQHFDALADEQRDRVSLVKAVEDQTRQCQEAMWPKHYIDFCISTSIVLHCVDVNQAGFAQRTVMWRTSAGGSLTPRRGGPDDQHARLAKHRHNANAAMSAFEAGEDQR